jgi:CRP-like cAMP-binding protein
MAQSSAHKALELYLKGLLGHSVLDDDDRAAIRSLPSTKLQLDATRNLSAAGDRPANVGLVVDGLIGRCRKAKDGVRQIVSLHLPGDMVNLSSLMLAEAPHPLVAMTRTTIAQIPHRALRDLAVQSSAIAAALLRDCLIDASIVTQWLFNIGRRNARIRVAHFFCEIACRAHAKGMTQGATFLLPMTQEQLGETLGLTPVHVNRTLRQLREEKLLTVSRGFVTIGDWDGLTIAGEFDSAYLHLPRSGDGPLANLCTREASPAAPAHLN